MTPTPHPDDEIAEALASLALTPDDAVGALEEMLEQLDPQAVAEAQRKEDEARRIRLSGLARKLYSEAQEQVRLRQTTEERWYSDVRQFNGQYEPNEFSDASQYGSRVFVPLTRRLVNLCEARLFDMLFPSEQRFFTVDPTPVPDVQRADRLASALPDDAQVRIGGQPVPAASVRESIKAMMDEAETRCDAMQREIDDQLAECRFPQVARDVIHDAVLYGTGVIKGPVPMIKTSRKWVNAGGGQHVLEVRQEPVPVAQRVDLWNFFPDMSCTSIADCERVWERHFLTRRQVADLKNMPDADHDALRNVLEADPNVSTDNYRERLRSINGATGATDRRYEIWEYHGPVTVQDLKDCGCEVEDEDPLIQRSAVVWFVEGEVIKAAMNHMDTADMPYRVFTWQRDESSIFGFGLPYEVRDQQVSANSSWRAMLDNMGLCVMPQVVVDDASIQPVDGSLGLAPGKFWRNKRPGTDARQAIQFISIDARLGELQSIFSASKALIEEVGTLPAFLQGQDAPGKMQSATEASIAWTAANLWVRRCVRNWDDDVITPLITAFYDYNMQWSPKEEIKGDSRVRALGIAALVELEGQATRMQQLAQAASGLGVPMSTQYSMLRELSRSLKIDPDRWLPTEQEVAKIKEQEQSQGPQPDVERMKLQVAQENNQMDHQVAMAGLQLKRDEIAARQQDMQARMQLELTQAAAQQQITQHEAARRYGFDLQKAQAEIADRERERQHKAQMLNAEMQLKTQLGSGV